MQVTHRVSTSLRRSALALALALAAAHGSVLAAGFQLIEQNASGLGNAYAGQAAAAEDASTVFFNPAGLTYLRGRQVVGALHLIAPNQDFKDKGSCAPFAGAGVGTSSCPFGPGGNLGHALGGDGGNSGSPTPVPNTYVAWELMPGSLWGGIGVNTPFGLTTKWDSDFIGRFHAIKSDVLTININPTLAWKANETFSFGAGLNIQYIDATLTNSVSYRAVALGSGNGGLIAAVPAGAEGKASVKGDDWSLGWNLGAMVNLNEATRLGVSYRSFVKHKLTGDVKFGNRPAALGVVPNVADGNVEVGIKLPETLSIGLAYQATPRLQLLADWTRTRWSRVQQLDINRTDGPLAGQTLSSLNLGFDNSWRAGLGANFRLNDAWKLRGGIAYDRTPVKNEFRTPRLADEDRFWIATGAQWTLAPNLVLDAGYAFINVNSATSRLDNQETATSLPRGSFVGKFDAHVHILSAQVRWGF